MVLGRLAVSLRKSNKIDYPLVEICIKMGKHERHKKKNANTLETEATADRCEYIYNLNNTFRKNINYNQDEAVYICFILRAEGLQNTRRTHKLTLLHNMFTKTIFSHWQPEWTLNSLNTFSNRLLISQARGLGESQLILNHLCNLKPKYQYYSLNQVTLIYL